MLQTREHGSSRHALRVERAGISGTPEINYLAIHMDVHIFCVGLQKIGVTARRLHRIFLAAEIHGTARRSAGYGLWTMAMTQKSSINLNRIRGGLGPAGWRLHVSLLKDARDG